MPHNHSHGHHEAQGHNCHHGHSHYSPGEGDWKTNANALVEFITGAATTFNFGLYAQNLIGGEDAELGVPELVLIGGISIIGAVASWYTHRRTNQFFEKPQEATDLAPIDVREVEIIISTQPNLVADNLNASLLTPKPTSKLSCGQNLALGVDGLYHSVDSASTLLSSLAFFKNIQRLPLGARIGLVAGAAAVGVIGTLAPFRNEKTAIEAHNQKMLEEDQANHSHSIANR